MALLSTDDLVLFDGISSQSLTDNRIRRGLVDALSDEYWEQSQLFFHQPTNRLFVSGVAKGSDRMSRALVLDLSANAWSPKELTYGYGFDSAYAEYSSRAWDDLTETWDELQGSWNQGVIRSSSPSVIAYESNAENTAWSVVLFTDYVNVAADGSVKFCEVVRRGLPIEGATGIARVTRVWPELTGEIESVQLQIGGMEHLDGEVRWGEVFDVVPRVTDSIAPRISGRYIAWRLRSNAAGLWRLGALTMEWQQAGER
jgi:hypothetical protein